MNRSDYFHDGDIFESRCKKHDEYTCLDCVDAMLNELGKEARHHREKFEYLLSPAHPEEAAIAETIVAARVVQDFLWKEINVGQGAEEFRRMFRKRLSKLDAIDLDRPYWRIEFRKRLLQVAAIAVNVIGKLDSGYTFVDQGAPSSLPEHSEKTDET